MKLKTFKYLTKSFVVHSPDAMEKVYLKIIFFVCVHNKYCGKHNNVFKSFLAM